MAAAKDNKIIYASQMQLYEKAVQKMNADAVIVQHAYKADNYRIAAAMFDEVGDYLDAKELAERCRTLAEETKADELETAYRRCADRMNDPSVFDDTDKLRKLEGQLEKLGGYKDSASMLEKCRGSLRRKDLHRKIKVRSVLGGIVLVIALFAVGIRTGYIKYYAGVAMMKYGKYGQAEKIFQSMPGFKDADTYMHQAELRRLRTAKTGSTVSFGGLKWYILDEQENILTGIAVDIGQEHIFYDVPFNKDGVKTTWKDSSLREWLNTEVYETQFSEEERSHMLLQTSAESVNTEYGTSYEQTEDYITILSAEEAENYEEALSTMGLDFWLRTPGESMDRTVYYSGGFHTIRMAGCLSDSQPVAVRPVIRLDRTGI